jgi:DNA polymerase-1
MTKTVLVDGNYYLHRAFSVAAARRSLDHVKKNTLDLFLKQVCSDIVTLKGTHALIVFDAPGSFRYEVYPQYKANRREGKDGKTTEVTRVDGTKATVDLTAGALVKDARQLVSLAGIAHSWVKGYEGDDLLGCAVKTIPGKKAVCTRDKDSAVLISEDGETVVYWPQEKQIIDYKMVKKLWKIEPHQMRDYLCLLGDKVDNIPGVDGIGPQTAAKLLQEHGSIAEALKDPKWLAKLKPHKKTLLIAKKLVTLRTDITFKIENLVIKDVDQELLKHVWAIPQSLKELGEARKLSKMKGLFG